MLPDTVHLPRPEDFCKNRFTDDVGRRCTLGWWRTLFPSATDKEFRRFTNTWRRHATQLHFPPPTSLNSIATQNDDPDISYKQLAECFERTVESLGYDIHA